MDDRMPGDQEPGCRAPSPLAEGLFRGAVAVLVGTVATAVSGWLRWPLDQPFGFVKGDDWDVQFTMLEAIGVQWAEGLLPVWNPWTGGGVPLLANPESPVFFVTGWMAAFFDLASVMRVNVLGHWVLLAFATVLLVRRLGGSRLAATVAAAGLLTTDTLFYKLAMGHLMMVHCGWALLAVVFFVTTPAPRKAGVSAGLAVAVASYAGAPQVAIFGLLACLAWCGLRLLRQWRALGGFTAILTVWIVGAGGPRWVVVLLGLGVGIFLIRRARRETASGSGVHPVGADLRVIASIWAVCSTALLSAPKWLTALWGLAEAPRLAHVSGGLGNAVYTGMGGLASIFLHSRVLDSVVRVDGMHNGQPSMATPVLLVLAIAGAWAIRRRVPELGAFVVLMVALSFAQNLPVNLWELVVWPPPLNRMRHPERLALLWNPMLFALAGLGLDHARKWTRWLLLPLLLANQIFATAESTWLTRIEAWPHPFVERGVISPPDHVLHPSSTNLDTLRSGIDCLDCRDAMAFDPPPVLGNETWGIEPDPVEAEWAPGRITFVARGPGIYVIREAWRRGWKVVGEGAEIESHAGMLGIRVPRAGTWVQLEFRPPGLRLAGLLFAFGLATVAIGFRNAGRVVPSRREGQPNASHRASPR